ncbi:hypothetical protein Esti_001555 [Eimeria stiedai]
MPVEDDGDDLALEASPPQSPGAQEAEPAGGPAAAAAASSRLRQQRGDWYATQQRACAIPAVAVTPLFVSGGALHSTSTKNKEVILPPTLTRASEETAAARDKATPQEKEAQQQSGSSSSGSGPSGGSPAVLGDGSMFAPEARVCSRPVTDFSHLAVQKEGKTMAVICLPWLYHKLQKEVLLLGRGEHADIHFDHPSCSRAHCEIRRVCLPDGTWAYTLEDLNSAHGTLVNGGKVAPRKPTVLDDEDEVQVGFSQRLYTFKKGDDKLGLQRSEAPPPEACPASSQQPLVPEEGTGPYAKPSFLQKHIERRARMGGFSRGRGGGFFSGDRQRFQHKEGGDRFDSGGYEGGRGGGAPHWRQGGPPYSQEGFPDGGGFGGSEDGGGGGPLRRERGGWQQSPYSPGGDGYRGLGGGPTGAGTGANTIPLGPSSWVPPPSPPSGGEIRGEIASPCHPPAPPPPADMYMPGVQGGPPYQPVGQGAPQCNNLPNELGAPYAATPAQGAPADMTGASQSAKPSFAKADRVYVHHIVLKFAGALNLLGQPDAATLRDGKTPMQRTREQARQYLEQARQLLQEHPEHFGDYAEELSDCASHARRGEVGWLLSNGQLESGELLFPPLMAAGALGLNVGQLSPVLESHMGFHLFLRTA